MHTEYEAKFYLDNVDEFRTKLRSVGTVLQKPETLYKRTIFDLPNLKGGWLRVRDEGDKVTMALKIVEKADSIEDQKEVELKIDNYDNAVTLFETLGYKSKAYQETKREIWMLDNVEICIDQWPYLPIFIEIEAKDELTVRQAAEKLGFDWKDALFGSADFLYAKKYGISIDVINLETPVLTFEEKPDFVKNL